jgi:polyvinyl alcohol dehydrogenase (cytochrome)
MQLNSRVAAFAAVGAVALFALGCTQPATQSAQETQAVSAPTSSASVAAAAAGEHPGKAVYDRACAACHNNPDATRSPSLEALRRMRFTNVNYALTEGKMRAQAAALTDAERTAVAEYLTGTMQANDAWVEKMMCPADRRVVDLGPAPTVAGFGFVI